MSLCRRVPQDAAVLYFIAAMNTRERICRTGRTLFTGFLVIFSLLVDGQAARAMLTIHSRTAVDLELVGYDGLAESSLFKGSIAAKGKQEIDVPYRGLALLSFTGGQSYPVIIGDESFTLKIADPGASPSFAGSGANDFFYKSLSGGAPAPGQYDFALLMIRAKQLLESSHTIHTVQELTAKKREFHVFVADHYDSLQHSDMIQRLIAQYFMMHEYVDYHSEGNPAATIRIQYQKAVLNGVGSWLEILKTHIPEQEILNYCVSLYYSRSMVTLASLIIENFRDAAYCPGAEKETFNFPADMLITKADGNKEKKMNEFRGNTIIAFVSDDCPVSMVETISKVRQLAAQKKDSSVIVAPLQELSGNHLAMNRMISSGKLFFINDEKWRKDNLAKKIKLPLFVRVGDDVE